MFFGVLWVMIWVGFGFWCLCVFCSLGNGWCLVVRCEFSVGRELGSGFLVFFRFRFGMLDWGGVGVLLGFAWF